mgnify:CR=1 FL=1
MNYEEMSDFEINKTVAHKVYSDLNGRDYTEHLVEKFFDEEGEICIFYCGGQPLDYCNNPSDAWSIIFDNKISLIFDWEKIGLYTATGTHSVMRKLGERKTKKEVTHENPLRAAMIVFLMMNEGES